MTLAFAPPVVWAAAMFKPAEMFAKASPCDFLQCDQVVTRIRIRTPAVADQRFGRGQVIG